MRIRRGFVSNSSSSSFILTTQLKKISVEDGKVTLSITVPLDSDLIEEVISTRKELYAYWEDYYGESVDEMRKDKESYAEELEQLEKLERLVDNGLTVIIGICSDEDRGGIGSYLYNNGFGDVTVNNGDLFSSEEYY